MPRAQPAPPRSTRPCSRLLQLHRPQQQPDHALHRKRPAAGRRRRCYPTSKAPFSYFIELHRPKPDGEYALTLKYRGLTGYGDGNRLSAIDSEMPGLLKRLGHWKEGEALPVPPSPPFDCLPLTMHEGVEWCAKDLPPANRPAP